MKPEIQVCICNVPRLRHVLHIPTPPIECVLNRSNSLRYCHRDRSILLHRYSPDEYEAMIKECAASAIQHSRILRVHELVVVDPEHISLDLVTCPCHGAEIVITRRDAAGSVGVRAEEGKGEEACVGF